MGENMKMIDNLKKGLKVIEGKNNDLKTNNIYNVFDYSNAVATKETISHLVKYCDNVYEQYLWLFNEQIQNKSIYSKKHNFYLDIRIKDKKFNIIICNSYMSFKKACLDGNLNNIESMEIRLNLSYKESKIYNNLFTIMIKPFNLKFVRQSNYDNLEMNIIEKNINEILKRFNTIDSIFCTK